MSALKEFLFRIVVVVLFLLVPICITLFTGAPTPLGVYLLDVFGLASGVAAIMMCVRRRRWIRLPRARQWQCAIAIWAAHITAFVVLVWSVS